MSEQDTRAKVLAAVRKGAHTVEEIRDRLGLHGLTVLDALNAARTDGLVWRDINPDTNVCRWRLAIQGEVEYVDAETGEVLARTIPPLGRPARERTAESEKRFFLAGAGLEPETIEALVGGRA